jgi:serine/threonine protein kinase/tetratricopeptide (TPR) repeat protein
MTETLRTPLHGLATGSTFAGRYQIIEELGKGGMGRVYKVFDTKIHEKVALKLIKPEVALDRETLERFSNEMKLARKVGHRNVCRMFDLGEADGVHFLTMEYVQGEDLKSMVRMSGTLSIGAVLSIGKQVADGLSEAHRLGIVHRDLKPQNIMIDKGGNAKIMDFGIARSIREKGITGPSVMIGTPEYMSPEQVEAKEVDERSDIYSLGIILYEMGTGHVPFGGETALSIAMKHKGERPRNPKEINPAIPDDLSSVILKCLEKDRAGRYQTAAEVRSELEKIEKGIPTTERISPKTKLSPSREITVKFRPRQIIIPASLVVFLIIAALVLWKVVLWKPLPLLPEQRRSIAIVSFENQTGDKNFDFLSRAIPDILITRLEQTGSLSVTTWDRLLDLLKQVKKPDVQFIDKDLGLELCRLDGTEVLAQGSFIKTGEMFAINVRLFDVAANRLLKTASSSGEGETSILKTQIDQLSKDIAKGFGISDRRVAADTAKAAEMTTSSPEAFKWYLMGKENFYKLDMPSAQRNLEKAVEIDPAFAMAYLSLFYTYADFGRPADARQAIEKAMTLAGKLGEKDRLLVEAAYAGPIENNLPKRIKILEEIIRKYPKEKTSLTLLGDILTSKGEFERALGLYEKASTLDPYDSYPVNSMIFALAALGRVDQEIDRLKDLLTRVPADFNSYDSLGLLYILSGNLDKAIVAFEDALAIKPDFWFPLLHIAYPLALKEDYSEVFSRLDKMSAVVATPYYKAIASYYRAFFRFWMGNRTKALSDLESAEKLMNDNKISGPFNASIHDLRVWVYLEGDEIEAGLQEIETTTEINKNDLPNLPRWECRRELALAFSYLKKGRLDSVKESLDRAKVSLERVESSTLRNLLGRQANILSAELALKEGRFNNIDGSFDKMTAYDFLNVVQSSTFTVQLHLPSLQDARARAFVGLGKIDNAIAGYETLITFDPKSRERLFIHPLYHYRLGKLYEQKGLKDKANAQYSHFLDLWKDADPGRPEVEDAKARLTRLKSAN